MKYPVGTSKESEVAFWEGSSLKGPHALTVWGLGGSRERCPTTAVSWGYRCCQNGNMGLTGTEMESTGTSRLWVSVCLRGVEDGP